MSWYLFPKILSQLDKPPDINFKELSLQINFVLPPARIVLNDAS